LNLIAELYP